MRIQYFKRKEKLYKLGTITSKAKINSVGDRKIEAMFQVLGNWYAFPEIWWSYGNIYVTGFQISSYNVLENGRVMHPWNALGNRWKISPLGCHKT